MLEPHIPSQVVASQVSLIVHEDNLVNVEVSGGWTVFCHTTFNYTLDCNPWRQEFRYFGMWHHVAA